MSKKNDWNPHFTRQHRRSKPTRPARREWYSRYHALVALICFSFAVGVTGDVRWLKAKPEIPVQPVSDLNHVYIYACECEDDSGNIERALNELGTGGTIYLSGTFMMTSTIELSPIKNVTIDGAGSVIENWGGGVVFNVTRFSGTPSDAILFQHNTFSGFNTIVSGEVPVSVAPGEQRCHQGQCQ